MTIEHLLGALYASSAMTLAYLVKKTYDVPGNTNPEDWSYKGDQCIGDAEAYRHNWKSQGCSSKKTRYVMLTAHSPTQLYGLNTNVPICEEHLARAELQHSIKQQQEPIHWKTNIFPMSSPTTRTYLHEPKPWDFRK